MPPFADVPKKLPGKPGHPCAIGEDPIITALNAAALEDVPLSDKEAKASDVAWNDYLDGRYTGKPLSQYFGEIHEYMASSSSQIC